MASIRKKYKKGPKTNIITMIKKKFNIKDYVKFSSSAEKDIFSNYDITLDKYVTENVALDTIKRNLHEPSFKELLKFYGIKEEELEN